MRNLTATICLTLAVLLGSGSANASEHCEDIDGPDYDASECEEASSGKDQKGSEVPKRFGGIGFPSGPVKNSEIVNLLLGNTLAKESSSNNGLVTRYFKKGGETKLCIHRGARCGKARWSVRDGQFCEKHPRINFGNWWCLVDAKYNDKTGELTGTTTGTYTYTYFTVYRGDMLVVEESNAVSKKTTSPNVVSKKSTSSNVVTEKVTSETISTTDKNGEKSSSHEDNDINKLEKRLEYLKARKVILDQIKGLENKLKLFHKKLEILKLEHKTGK